MTSVTFENATIRDVIGKASRVAPTRGSAFDKASGIVMEVDIENNEIVVRATNIEIFYMEIADSIEMSGTSASWRIPSGIIDGICSKLPISSGKTVTFDDEAGHSLKITSGRMRANIRIMDTDYYPRWEAFDPSELETVSEFGARIQMVQWAALKNGEPPMTGVHLDGEFAIATDRHKIAMVPCKATPLYKPVTVPAGIFTPLMKSLGDVRLGIQDNMLLIQPDDSVQIKAVIFGNAYPNIPSVLKRNETGSVTFKKALLLEIIDRAMVMAARDRLPLLKMFVGQEEIAVMMTDKEIGLLGDVIEVPGHAMHDRMTICFTPDNLTGAINNAPSDEITMYYHLGEPNKPVRIDGGSGYESLIMPRKEMSDGE